MQQTNALCNSADLHSGQLPDGSIFAATGKEETAADVYGALNGSSSNISQTEMILEDFPQVEMFIEQKEAEAISDYFVLDRAS